MHETKKIKIPEVAVIPRTDFPQGWKFFCVYCKKCHLHGIGLGDRSAHCINNDSPYLKTGYILVDLRHETIRVKI